MNEFVSHSQAMQDRFVYEVLVKGMGIEKGTFLDIGCNGASNTLALEEIGWTGILLDINPPDRERDGLFTQDDATTFKWHLPPIVDYLSLDVDENTPDALKNLPLSSTRFRVATIEHDSYRFGDEPKNEMRVIMWNRGYHLVCADVKHDGLPFEDWWCDPNLVSADARYKFECAVGKEYTEIFKHVR